MKNQCNRPECSMSHPHKSTKHQQTKSTYTPGPWKLEADRIWAGDEICVVNLFGAMGGDNTEADAHLIAAAPELIEALKGMLEWARRVKEHTPGMEVATACNAVAKAEGH